MAEKTAPNLGLKYGYTTGESGWGGGYNANQVILDTLTQLSVVSATVTTPPVSPADGDRYILPFAATGGWAGHGGQLAVWLTDAAAWQYFTPAEGWAAYVRDTDLAYRHTGLAWAAESVPAATVVKDEGTTVLSATAINFVGAGVTATDGGSGIATITIPGASAITAQDEGSTLTAAATTLNFVGAGVTATEASGVVTVTIPGSSGSALTAKDEGSTLSSAVTTLDFVGAGVTATAAGAVITVTIPGNPVTLKDEGTNVTTGLTSIDFVGAGVTATGTGAVTVTIPGPTIASDAPSDGKFYYRQNAGWTLGPQDISLYLPGVQPTDSRVARYVFARGVSLPAGLTGSQAVAAVAATGATTLTLKNSAGTALGTINFAAGATVGTFTFASLVSFAAGAVLDVYSPSSADATLADIAMTFVGTRT